MSGWVWQVCHRRRPNRSRRQRRPRRGVRRRAPGNRRHEQSHHARSPHGPTLPRAHATRRGASSVQAARSPSQPSCPQPGPAVQIQGLPPLENRWHHSAMDKPSGKATDPRLCLSDSPATENGAARPTSTQLRIHVARSVRLRLKQAPVHENLTDRQQSEMTLCTLPTSVGR